MLAFAVRDPIGKKQPNTTTAPSPAALPTLASRLPRISYADTEPPSRDLV
jgi:hypothetical protein